MISAEEEAVCRTISHVTEFIEQSAHIFGYVLNKVGLRSNKIMELELCHNCKIKQKYILCSSPPEPLKGLPRFRFGFWGSVWAMDLCHYQARLKEKSPSFLATQIHSICFFVLLNKRKTVLT